MEYACHTSLQLLFCKELFQGVPCGAEHAGIENGLVGQGYLIQTFGNSEHHMEIRNFGYHFFLALVNPYLPVLVLTLGTVSVTTAVVADMPLSTFRTDFHMSAKRLRATCSNCPKCLLYMIGSGLLGKELLTPVTDDLSYVKTRTIHANMVSIR